MPSPFALAAVLIACAACVTDLATRRVPNVLTLPAIAAGVLAHSILPNGQGVGAAALGAIVGLAVFFPIFALGGLGAGDVKLMAALGSWIGAMPVVWVALYGAVAGGVLAIFVSVSQGYLRQALTNIGSLFLFWSVQGVKPMPALTLEHGRGPRLPYALPILIGLLATVWTRA